ncbi:uncharacterized protein LOC141718673 [Apium graveolens]|uniref:uncharacterized protein LOC141718673 n=1 Tax=Apium graveolens TaxID=4045 RepID=UPI003D7B8039
MGLNDSYAVARGQVLMMSHLPTLSHAFSLINQDEKQKQGSHVPSVFLGSVSDAYSNAQKFVNTSGGFSKSFGISKSGLKCSYCHKEGHLKEQCYKLIGYPDKKKGKGKFQNPNTSTTTSTNASSGFRQLPQALNVSSLSYPQSFSGQPPMQGILQTPISASGRSQSVNSPTIEQLQSQMTQMNQMMMLMMNKQNNSSPEDHVNTMAGMVYSFHTYSFQHSTHLWIVDTGASSHMCSNRTLLTNIRFISQPYHIVLPNKHIISVTQIGTVFLAPSIILKDVLFVPDFHCNFLSVSKLTQDHACVVSFLENQCIFQDQKHQKLLATSNQFQGLYYFTHSPSSSAGIADPVASPVLSPSFFSNVTTVSPISVSKFWHMRLGHIPDNVLSHIPISVQSEPCSKKCPVCPLSKQYKIPFPKFSASVSTESFALIHMDIWGPYHIATNTGCKYFLTIVDDYTRATWVFLMPNKQQILSIFQTFVSHVAT